MSARFSILATAPSDLERLPDLILRQLQSAAHLSEVLSSPRRCASASVLACASGDMRVRSSAKGTGIEGHQSAENGTGVARPFNDLLIFFGREPAHDVIALSCPTPA
jgi:hypothetical protein